MDEYVCKSALIGWTLSRIYQKDANNMVYEVRKIEDFPAADVAPVRHGKWEIVDQEEPRTYGCSVCKRLARFPHFYCPNCGAKMEEEE